jgi:hypothetical protein
MVISRIAVLQRRRHQEQVPYRRRHHPQLLIGGVDPARQVPRGGATRDLELLSFFAPPFLTNCEAARSEALLPNFQQSAPRQKTISQWTLHPDTHRVKNILFNNLKSV